MDELTGGCACGRVRYRLTAPPMWVNCCHCTCCQTESGSAFAINALIEAGEVETTKGAVEPVLTPTESGRGQQVWRCPDCEVALWSNYGTTDDRLRFVRVGSLDRPGLLPPDAHIFTRSKLAWVELPAAAITADEHYDRAAIWPPASLERLRAVR